jgi:hypothetical protein
VVRGDERMLAVEAEVDAGMRLPVIEQLIQRATRTEHDRDAPDQQVVCVARPAGTGAGAAVAGSAGSSRLRGSKSQPRI